MIVYLDLIIIENFLMNFLILFTTGKIMCRKLHIWKIALASLIGDLYTFLLFVDLPVLIVDITKVLMAAFLVKISLGSDGIKKLVKETTLFLIISFIYAGCSLAFVYLCKPKVVYIVNGVIIGGRLIFEVVVCAAICSFFLIRICPKIICLRKKLSKKDMICYLKLSTNNKSVEMNAFIDTGNLLCDPISKDPVVVVNYENAKKLFNGYDIEVIDGLMGDFSSKIEFIDSRYRIIPFSSLGNKDGLLVVTRVDCIELIYNEKLKRAENVLIGFCKQSLSHSGQYEALIGLKMLEEGADFNELSSDVKGKGKCGVC